MTDKAVVPARRRERRRKTTAHPAARAVRRHAKKVITSPWAERAARLGYVVRGIIYGTMGVLALGLAVGLDSGSTDQRGTLAPLGENPVGRLFLFVVVVSLLAYAGWGLIRAIYDPLHRGDDPPGIASRIGFAWSGLNYAALAVFATGLLFGGTKRGSGDGVQQIVGWALQLPAGGVIVTVAGVIGILGGLGQFADAYKAGFRGDLKRNQMNSCAAHHRRRARALRHGRAGRHLQRGRDIHPDRRTSPRGERCAQLWTGILRACTRTPWPRPACGGRLGLRGARPPLVGECALGADAPRLGGWRFSFRCTSRCGISTSTSQQECKESRDDGADSGANYIDPGMREVASDEVRRE